MWWELVIPFLKDIFNRVVPDPTERLQFEEKMAELALKAQELEVTAEQARGQEFAQFVSALQPSGWANGFVALTRPLITWIVMGSIVASFFIPGLAQRITDTLAGFQKGGTPGLILLSIPLFWFLGRSIEKIILPGGAGVSFGGMNGNGRKNGTGVVINPPRDNISNPTRPTVAKPVVKPSITKAEEHDESRSER